MEIFFTCVYFCFWSIFYHLLCLSLWCPAFLDLDDSVVLLLFFCVVGQTSELCSRLLWRWWTNASVGYSYFWVSWHCLLRLSAGSWNQITTTGFGTGVESSPSLVTHNMKSESLWWLWLYHHGFFFIAVCFTAVYSSLSIICITTNWQNFPLLCSIWHITIYTSSFFFLCSMRVSTRNSSPESNYELTRQDSLPRSEPRET